MCVTIISLLLGNYHNSGSEEQAPQEVKHIWFLLFSDKISTKVFLRALAHLLEIRYTVFNVFFTYPLKQA